MNIKIKKLILYCKELEEIIDLESQISFFHGKVSAGKSTIARAIDYCLGGKIENTPAIKQELVSVQILCSIESKEVLFERVYGSNKIQVTWRDNEAKQFSILAPITSETAPIWNSNIFNISDLIFYLSEISPLKVKRSKIKDDSPLIRLSFRDIMWYCYLKQARLDSSFFRLEDSYRKLKSRDVMRFIVGFYTEKINELEIKLDVIKKQIRGKSEGAEKLKELLDNFNLGSENEINKQIEQIRKELNISIKKMIEKREDYSDDTHFADELREKLRDFNKNLNIEEENLIDLDYRITEQKSLKSELISSKFKLARHESATKILSDVKFEICPICASKLNPPRKNKLNTCYLCKSNINPELNHGVKRLGPVYNELDSRINELSESITKHDLEYKRQKEKVKTIKEEKLILDNQLKAELKNYDSSYMARFLELERNISTKKEKIRNLEGTQKMPRAVEELENEAENLRIIQKRVELEIEDEKKNLVNARSLITELEEKYLEILLTVGVPGVSEDDKVKINLTTWIPYIFSGGDENLKWDFYNAGSGGKKTLLNVCYALALHCISAQHNLPLPTFLIIDTPMKNIGVDVNEDIFISFYEYLYELAESSLSNTQIIIIDKEYVEPSSKTIKIYERLMTPNDDKFPPLISYYRGP